MDEENVSEAKKEGKDDPEKKKKKTRKRQELKSDQFHRHSVWAAMTQAVF